MQRLTIALATWAALCTPAFASDPAANTRTSAPGWSGFYLSGGAGGGIWASDSHASDTVRGNSFTVPMRQSGNGWFGTVGAGYDWSASPNWLAGLFADGQFGNLIGTNQTIVFGGRIKLQESWAAGARLGYRLVPHLFVYGNAGYSGSRWSGAELYVVFTGAPEGAHIDAVNRNGWFVGGGIESDLNLLGLQASGWSLKTEYRAAFYGNKALTTRHDGTNLPFGFDINLAPWVQTLSTSLVYRFNWADPVVAKY